MPFRIGVDVGGTFIDLVVADETRSCRLYKTLSDPANLAGALLDGLTVAADEEGIPLGGLLARTEMIIHGSTVATNALLTRTGAKTALLTTAGFRDVLNMRRGLRENQYDPRQEPPHRRRRSALNRWPGACPATQDSAIATQTLLGENIDEFADNVAGLVSSKPPEPEAGTVTLFNNCDVPLKFMSPTNPSTINGIAASCLQVAGRRRRSIRHFLSSIRRTSPIPW